jgi:hypothetical protein
MQFYLHAKHFCFQNKKRKFDFKKKYRKGLGRRFSPGVEASLGPASPHIRISTPPTPRSR